ncbi:MAG TPA: glycosyl hydrolase [Dictyoglomaceae bacterium]|nr:glycosyl hydrolase [Dictyoglomaceae bacterium]HOL39979.1 glycosyl hydrolase [Dictyoglomaceae bacterium]HPP16629.1 glycosyl hydrolase [Dictyoglomaceae bacterium]
MRKKILKVIFPLLFLAPIFTFAYGASPKIYQAEDGVLNGTVVAKNLPGYQGKGYVDGFDKDGDSCTITVEVESEGLYEIIVGYAAPFGYKENSLYVNGVFQSNIKFNPSQTFTTVSAGLVPLKAGKNTISIVKSWGWFYLDFIEIRSSETPTLNVEPKLVNPNASPEAKKLMNYLVSIYGKNTLSGQAGIMDCYFIKDTTGKFPALCGFDMMDYSPSRVEYGTKPYEVENAIKWWKEGGIVQFQWHWNAPKDLYNVPGKEWWRGFYTEATSFDVEYALNHPESEDYKLIIRDLDAIAEQLKRLRDAGVPVLWRPLHEAEGKWFWWGAKGPEACKKLYKLMFDRFTNYHKLNNLIWVWTTTDSPDALKWYPGDEYVDIVGADIYLDNRNYSPSAGTFYNLVKIFGGKKLVALTENGIIPDPDAMIQQKAYWVWFMTWNGFENDPSKNEVSHLKKVFNHSLIITRDELPKFIEEK